MIFQKPFYILFKIEPNSVFVIIFSMLTGFPSSAKYINNLLKEDLISIEDANKIIRYCHFSNPLFVINVIGNEILENKLLGVFILLSHYLANFLIAFIYRNEPISSRKNVISKSQSFGNILSKSINSSFNSLLIILGNIIFFQLLTIIIFNYFNFNSYFKPIISSLIEITDGIYMIKSMNANIIFKSLIISSVISFGGFCIHSQTYSILYETNVKYKNYLIGRLLQAVITPIILLIILFCYRI